MAKRFSYGVLIDTKDAEGSIQRLTDHLADLNNEVVKDQKAIITMENELEKLGDTSGKTSKSMLDGFSAIPGPIGAMSGALKGALTGVKSLTLGFKGLAGAIAATGIGLLVVALGVLVAYFTSTEGGAQKLRVITAALSSAFGTLKDIAVKVGEILVRLWTEPKKVLSEFADTFKKYIIDNFTLLFESLGKIGGAIVKLFKRDFSGALEDAKSGLTGLVDAGTRLNPLTAGVRLLGDGLAEVGKEMAKDVKNAIELEKSLNDVIVSERDLADERSKSNVVIAEARLIAKDTNLSLAERSEALKTVIKLETDLADKEVKNEQERLRILEAQAELNSTDEATLQALSDQRAVVSKLQVDSLNLRKALTVELTTLDKKAGDDARKEAEATAKAHEENEKAKTKLTEEETKRRNELIKALEESRIAIMAEGLDKDIAEQNLAFQRRLDAITTQGAEETELRRLIEEERTLVINNLKQQYKEEEEENDRIDSERKAKKAESDSKKEIDEAKKAQSEKDSLRNASFQAATNIASQLQSLSNSIFETELNNAKGNAKEEEKIRKKAFEANKAFGIIGAVISTAQAVISGFNAGASLGPAGVVMGPVMAALAAATGIAQIVAIASAKYQPTGGGGGTIPTPPSAPSVPSAGSSQQPSVSFTGSGNNLNTVGGGAIPQPNISVNANVSISETEITGTQNTVSEYENASLLSG